MTADTNTENGKESRNESNIKTESKDKAKTQDKAKDQDKAKKKASNKPFKQSFHGKLEYGFVAATAAIPMLVMFRIRHLYESDAAKKRIKGGALFVSNHVGFMDPMILMTSIWYRRQHFVCLKIFFEGKKGFLFKMFQCIPIDRENVSMNTMNAITNYLKAGEVVTIFPEGHINQEEGLGTFKSGMCLMAMRGNAPIIPIYIKKREHWWERVTTVVGEPIDIKEITGGKPSLAKIEEVTRVIQEKTEKLERIALGKASA